MYQPLPVLFLSLNYHFSGMNPSPMHLFNLLLHLINIILVFRLVGLLFRNRNIALIIAFIFAIHPMNVEAVSWISARSSGMYTCFYLLSLIFYIRYVNLDLKTRFFIYSFLFFVLSLFSKSQAVTLPLVLILIDLFYQRKLVTGKVILEKIPFFILSIIFSWITINNPSAKEIMTKGMLANYSPLDDFFMVCYSFGFYMVRFLAPFNLCAAYVYPPKTGSLLPFGYYLSPLILVAAGLLIYRFRRIKFVKFGALLFLATIFINIQLIPSRLVIVADRYGYFPYLGLMIISVALIKQLIDQYPLLFRKYKTAGLALLLCYAAFFSVTLVSRNATWNNDYVFMSDMINKNPPVPYLYRAYGTRGNWLKRQNRPEEALQDYSKAIDLKPDNALAYVNRASLNMQRKAFHEVISDADKAIALNYRPAAIFQIRSVAKFYQGDFAGALGDCDQCIRLDSTRKELFELRSVILDSLKGFFP